jgi:hypothetical protein
MAVAEIFGTYALAIALAAAAGDIEPDHSEEKTDHDGAGDIGKELGGTGRAGIKHRLSSSVA